MTSHGGQDCARRVAAKPPTIEGTPMDCLSSDGIAREPGYHPDGLTEQIIDALLREVDGAAAVKPQPSSALMDGTGAQRRSRRAARRSVAAVVRVLPVRGQGGWAA